MEYRESPQHPPLAERVRRVRQTELRRLSARCAELGGINLSQGICDLPVPPVLCAGVRQALEAGHSTYTNLAGIRELRQAIAAKMKDFNGLEIDADREVAVTVGSAGAFACATLATLNPGDEVLLFEPFYNYYVEMLNLLGVNVRLVPTPPPDWQFAPADLAAAFTPRTRMILVNTPSNPTGKVFSVEELSKIAALALRHNCWIVTDEIYEYITYARPHVSAATLPDAAGRTITLSGPSKTYAVTGWRVGYAVGPAEVIARILVVSDALNICAPAPLQHGVLAGMGLPASYYEDMRNQYRARRDLLAETLSAIGFTVFLPQGAFYLMADFGAGRYPSALAAAESILEEVGVATVPGASFYAAPGAGETQLRFCFAKRAKDMDEACRRLRRLR